MKGNVKSSFKIGQLEDEGKKEKEGGKLRKEEERNKGRINGQGSYG